MDSAGQTRQELVTVIMIMTHSCGQWKAWKGSWLPLMEAFLCTFKM